jgi:hypothetical protein
MTLKTSADLQQHYQNHLLRTNSHLTMEPIRRASKVRDGVALHGSTTVCCVPRANAATLHSCVLCLVC